MNHLLRIISTHHFWHVVYGILHAWTVIRSPCLLKIVGDALRSETIIMCDMRLNL